MARAEPEHQGQGAWEGGLAGIPGVWSPSRRQAAPLLGGDASCGTRPEGDLSDHTKIRGIPKQLGKHP